jgi:hypothetical protein
MSERKAKTPVSFPGDVVEALRKMDPMFCQFLEETGRLKIN